MGGSGKGEGGGGEGIGDCGEGSDGGAEGMGGGKSGGSDGGGGVDGNGGNWGGICGGGGNNGGESGGGAGGVIVRGSEVTVMSTGLIPSDAAKLPMSNVELRDWSPPLSASMGAPAVSMLTVASMPTTFEVVTRS